MHLWFENNRDRLVAAAVYLFEHPELALEETASANYLADLLAREGFSVTRGIGGLPTAFVAQWGSGKPVLGFLAEYDALPGLGQAPVPHREPLPGCGHGCGHNLLGLADAAAAMALKHQMETEGLAGTIRVYGCPAEETLYGKVAMLKEGCFDGLDAAITWHPMDGNRVSEEVWLAMDVKRFRFYGKTAHAAGAPHLGRSALDAAELMNIGSNYLREHVPDDVRIHYAYLHGGEAANIVPDYAETEYYIRSRSRITADDVTARIDNIAKGAAFMTDTRVEVELKTRCAETKLNHTLIDVFYQAMAQTPLPEYTPAEQEFAAQICEAAGFAVTNTPFDGLQPKRNRDGYVSVSTDVSNVSQVIPTVMIHAATACKGTPLHHWAFTAQAGMSIGHKGMLYAAEAMAIGALSLLQNPRVLEAAWAEHQK